jgi:hypothetical protein
MNMSSSDEVEGKQVLYVKTGSRRQQTEVAHVHDGVAVRSNDRVVAGWDGQRKPLQEQIGKLVRCAHPQPPLESNKHLDLVPLLGIRCASENVNVCMYGMYL